MTTCKPPSGRGRQNVSTIKEQIQLWDTAANNLNTISNYKFQLKKPAEKMNKTEPKTTQMYPVPQERYSYTEDTEVTTEEREREIYWDTHFNS